MMLRAVTVVVWAALGASAVAWGLRLGARGLPAPPEASALAAGSAARHAGAEWQRVLGDDQVAAPEPSAAPAAEPGLEQRLRLLGLAGPRELSRVGGVALIAVDGGAARAYRVGQAVEGRHVLQRVGANVAEIGPPGMPAAARLELPALPPAATGTLPPAAASPATAAPAFTPAARPVPVPVPAPAQRLQLPPERDSPNAPGPARVMQ